MFEWLNQVTISKLSPFIEKHGKNKIIKWSMIFCGAGALSAIGNGGVISFIFFSLATTYIFSTTEKGEKINSLFKEKKLITKSENSEYWLAVILTLIAFMFYPNSPSISQAEGLTQQEKKEVKNLSYDAKLHCHVAVKMGLVDLDSSVSFPYTYRQLQDQTYVVNMRGKVENLYGGKTKKEWDCQIQYNGNGNGKTNKVENWKIEALEERDI